MSTEQDTFPVSAMEMKKMNMFYHSITDMMAIVHHRLRTNFDNNFGSGIIVAPTKVVVTCKNVYETKHCLTSIIIVPHEVDNFRNEQRIVLFEILPNLFGFMLLYKKLIDILETNSTLAAECPLIYESFFMEINNFVGKMKNPIFDELGKLLINAIKNRLVKTGNNNLLLFLSTFIFEGKQLIRSKYSNLSLDNNDEQVHLREKTHFELGSKDTEYLDNFVEYEYYKMIESYNNQNRRNIDFIAEINEGSSDIIEYDDDMESDEISYLNSLSAILNVSDNDNEKEDSPGNREDLHKNSLFEDYSPIDYDVSFIKEYSKNNDIPESLTNAIIEKYIFWMVNPISQVIYWTQRIPNVSNMWKTLSFMKEWKDLSLLAIRYLTLSSSEASAERMFSLQRFAISKHRYRTKKRLEESRMIYSVMK